MKIGGPSRCPTKEHAGVKNPLCRSSCVTEVHLVYLHLELFTVTKKQLCSSYLITYIQET